MGSRKPLIAGNWKMNLTLSQAVELVNAVGTNRAKSDDVDVLVAPPFTFLGSLVFEIENICVDHQKI